MIGTRLADRVRSRERTGEEKVILLRGGKGHITGFYEGRFGHAVLLAEGEIHFLIKINDLTEKIMKKCLIFIEKALTEFALIFSLKLLRKENILFL